MKKLLFLVILLSGLTCDIFGDAYMEAMACIRTLPDSATQQEVNGCIAAKLGKYGLDTSEPAVYEIYDEMLDVIAFAWSLPSRTPQYLVRHLKYFQKAYREAQDCVGTLSPISATKQEVGGCIVAQLGRYGLDTGARNVDKMYGEFLYLYVPKGISETPKNLVKYIRGAVKKQKLA